MNSSLVDTFISRFELDKNDYLFDPFCGMGTTLYTAALRGIPSLGIDKLPIATFIAKTLPLFHTISPSQLYETLDHTESLIQEIVESHFGSDEEAKERIEDYDGLISKIERLLRSVTH